VKPISLQSLLTLRAVSILLLSLSLSAKAAEHPVSGEPLAEEQVFTYRLLDSIPSLDPQVSESVEGSAVARDLFEGLVNQDANGDVVPGVATSWSSNAENSVYTFLLRKDARWSNGDPVVAGDFVYGWQRAADPELASPYSWYLQLAAIEGVDEILEGKKPITELGITALDDHTLEVSLSKSVPYFAQMVSQPTLFPAHRATIEKHGSDWTKPGNMISNGAYILTELVPGERIVRERNTQYWNNDATIINKTIALIINNENQALTRYLAGELDRTEVPAGQFPKLKEEYPNEAISFPRLCNYYYTFNLSDSGPAAFKDVKVRQALSLALDRRIITENILAGGQPEAYTFTPAAVAGFDIPTTEMATMSQADRDAKAKNLLDEAGFSKSNPLKFNLLYNTSEAHQKVAVAVGQMWKQKLGVETTLANKEWKTFLETRGEQDFELARGAWCGDYNEASTFLDLLTTKSGYNDGKYSNSELDDLMAKAQVSSETSAIYSEMEMILARDMPVIPVYHYTGVYMLSSNLRGWPIQNVQQKWYSRELYKVAE